MARDEKTKKRKRKAYRALFKRPPNGLRPYWRRMAQAGPINVHPENERTTLLSISLVDCVIHPHSTIDWQRPAIRVISVFDGIATGFCALQEVGLEIGAYFSSEIDERALMVQQNRHGGIITRLGGIRGITAERLRDIGRIDLLFGGSPCSDLSLVNPRRRGLYGEGTTGDLFFEYVRVLRCLTLQAKGNGHAFYWMFENTRSMEKKTLQVMSRYLGSDPTEICSSAFTAMVRKRFFWGNVPGLQNVGSAKPTKSHTLQDYLKPGRYANIQYVPTITTSQCSQRKGTSKILPVRDEDGKGSELYITEIESLFGLPDSYTDGPNISVTGRRHLLGKAWCMPVVAAILRPLRVHFKCSEQM